MSQSVYMLTRVALKTPLSNQNPVGKIFAGREKHYSDVPMVPAVSRSLSVTSDKLSCIEVSVDTHCIPSCNIPHFYDKFKHASRHPAPGIAPPSEFPVVESLQGCRTRQQQNLLHVPASPYRRGPVLLGTADAHDEVFDVWLEVVVLPSMRWTVDDNLPERGRHFEISKLFPVVAHNRFLEKIHEITSSGSHTRQTEIFSFFLRRWQLQYCIETRTIYLQTFKWRSLYRPPRFCFLTESWNYVCYRGQSLHHYDPYTSVFHLWSHGHTTTPD